MKDVLVPLADGFEEIEAATVVDVLRRAGLTVITAGMPSTIVQGSRGMKMMTDRKFEDVNHNQFDALVLIGGDPGYRNLNRSQKVHKVIRDFNTQGKLIAAICAAPTILADAGMLDERVATVYPGMEKKIPKPRDKKVLLDGNILTSKAPGTAMEFSLKIVEILIGPETVLELRRDLVC